MQESLSIGKGLSNDFIMNIIALFINVVILYLVLSGLLPRGADYTNLASYIMPDVMYCEIYFRSLAVNKETNDVIYNIKGKFFHVLGNTLFYGLS